MGLNWLGLGLVLGVQLAVLPVFAADLATIRDRGRLVVAVREGWRPLSYRDSKGDLVGLEVDMAHRLAEAILGDPGAVELRVVGNGDRLSAVMEGQVDVAIAGITLTPGRQRLVSFSPPYYLDGTGVLVPAPGPQRLADLQQQRLGVLQGASAVAVVRHLLPQVSLQPLGSYQEAAAALEAGQIDGFAGDLTVLTGWQQTEPSYALVPGALSADPLAIALPKGSQYQDLRLLVHQAVMDWHHSGWLEERAAFWGLP